MYKHRVLKEFFQKVNVYTSSHSEVRLGQAYMNVIAMEYPVACRIISETDADCFFDDNRCDVFLGVLIDILSGKDITDDGKKLFVSGNKETFILLSNKDIIKFFAEGKEVVALYKDGFKAYGEGKKDINFLYEKIREWLEKATI